MKNITFTMLKPDSVSKGNIGKIIDKIIQDGFEIVAMKYTRLSIEDASEFLMGTSLSKAERKSLWLSWSADELLTMLESRKRDEVWTARIKMRLAELEREGRGFEDKGGTTDEID